MSVVPLECAAQALPMRGASAVASAFTSDWTEKIRSARRLEGPLLQDLRFSACDFGTPQEALFSVLQPSFTQDKWRRTQ